MMIKKKITINHYWSRAKLDPQEHPNDVHSVYTHVSTRRMNNYFKSIYVQDCTGEQFLMSKNHNNEVRREIEKEKKFISLLLQKIGFQENEWLTLKGIHEFITVFEKPIIFDFTLKRLKDHLQNELLKSRYSELLRITDWRIDSRTIFYCYEEFAERSNDSMLKSHLATVLRFSKITEKELKEALTIDEKTDLHAISLDRLFSNSSWCTLLNKQAMTDEIENILKNPGLYQDIKSTEPHLLSEYIKDEFEVILNHLSDVDEMDELKFRNFKFNTLTHIFS